MATNQEAYQMLRSLSPEWRIRFKERYENLIRNSPCKHMIPHWKKGLEIVNKLIGDREQLTIFDV